MKLDAKVGAVEQNHVTQARHFLDHAGTVPLGRTHLRAGAARAAEKRVAFAQIEEQVPMSILNLYADADGETHFRDIEVECDDERPWGNLSKHLPATGLIFVEAPGTTTADWHPAPCRQYVIVLNNQVEATASDGERRIFGAGEVVLVEDTTGKGHLTRMRGESLHRAVFLPAG